MKKYFSALLFSLLLVSVSFAADGFTSIFNGQDLTGWKPRGGFAQFSVRDGVIVGVCAPNTPGNTFLCTEKEYANFVLRLEAKFEVMSNSGVQVRSHTRPNKDRETIFGYQCEFADRVAVGQIYDEGRRAYKYATKFRDLRRPDEWFSDDAPRAYKKDDWNQVEIQCLGPSIRTWINGVPCANMIDVLDAEGFIGLQVHAGGRGTILFRNIEIKELPTTAWEPGLKTENDFAVRAKLPLETVRALLPAETGAKFFRNGENSYAAAIIGDRVVQIVNDLELQDVTDANAASALREKLGKTEAAWETMMLTPEQKAQIER